MKANFRENISLEFDFHFLFQLASGRYALCLRGVLYGPRTIPGASENYTALCERLLQCNPFSNATHRRPVSLFVPDRIPGRDGTGVRHLVLVQMTLSRVSHAHSASVPLPTSGTSL